jgi:2-C-methyl-D-erythritol 4-phosphate cytidylyltransferase
MRRNVFFSALAHPTLWTRPGKGGCARRMTRRRDRLDGANARMSNDSFAPATAILLAAGQSTRMAVAADRASAPRKPFLVLEGVTVLEHACAAFDRAPSVLEIVIVAHALDVERIQAMAARSPALRKVRAVVRGGELRTDSVRAGVAAADERSAVVAIHDVARALVEPEAIERVIAAAARGGGALLAVRATDTIKVSSDGELTDTTLDRSVLWCAQTPQAFRIDIFRELLERAAADDFRPTDDAALYERYRGGVAIVPGDARNIKLTTPDDLPIANAILRARAARGAST